MSSANEKRPVPESVWSSSYLSAALAVLLILEVVGISVYAYYRIQRALDPERVADRVEQAVQENYPELRQRLVTEIHQQAPAIAEQVSQELIAATPEARRDLEQFTARQLDRGIEKATQLSAEQFRQFLRDNREQIVEVFERIEAAPQEAHELVLQMEQDLEQQLGVDVQNQAREVLQLHAELNDKLERLADPNAELRRKEQFERRIVRILKAMEKKYLENARLTMRMDRPRTR